MDRQLDSLSSDFKPVVVDILARLVERGVMVMVVQTSRTLAEHEANLSSGASATPLSKHLPRKLRGLVSGTADDEKADAIDICPYELFQLAGPDKLTWSDTATPADAQAFAIIRDLCEAHAARSGARWKTPHDPGHMEWLFSGERHEDIPTTSAAYQAHGIHGGQHA